MTKQFEDYFTEPQADMVTICMEYSEGKADDIYIYCSWEHNWCRFDVFFKAKDIVIRKHKLNNIFMEIDTSIERQKSMISIGNKNLDLIHDICKKHNHDMPTEIKLHYNVNANSLKANYKYDLVYSNQKDTSPNDVFNAWFEEVKNENEQ